MRRLSLNQKVNPQLSAQRRRAGAVVSINGRPFTTTQLSREETAFDMTADSAEDPRDVGGVGDQSASKSFAMRQHNYFRALPLSQCSHGIVQSPFCHTWSGSPPVLRTSTTSPDWEKL